MASGKSGRRAHGGPVPVSILVLVKYGLGANRFAAQAWSTPTRLNSCSGEVWPRGAMHIVDLHNNVALGLNSCSGEVWPRGSTTPASLPRCGSGLNSCSGEVWPRGADQGLPQEQALTGLNSCSGEVWPRGSTPDD